MDPYIIFSIAGAIILLGFLGERIFEKTSIPDPIWLMLFGVLLGYFYPIANNDIFRSVGGLFTVFALIFLLFEGVLSTDLRSFFTGVLRGSGVAVAGFFITIAVTAAFMSLLGWGLLEGL